MRREDARLVTGRGHYVSDVRLENCVHVAFVRADLAGGRIADIDTRDAASAAGVAGVFTGADVAHIGSLTVSPVLGDFTAQPFDVLAKSRVGSVGQPVAAIAADSPQAARDAADLVFVELDDETAEEVSLRTVSEKRWRQGDTAAAMASAAHVVEVDTRHPRLAPAPMEPRAAAADFDPETGTVKVWLSTQTPHRARSELARILAVEPDRIHVVAPDVGGAFGMKASLYPEDVFTVWAAFTLKRSVRWTATRSEDFVAASHGRAAAASARLGIDAEGHFLALEAETSSPVGQWLTTSALVPAWNAGRILPGPYRVGSVDIQTRALPEPTAPVGIYRGAGRPEAAFLMERLVEEAARLTGLDPMEIRRRNFVPPQDMPWTGPTDITLDSGDFAATLQMLQEACGYEDLLAARDRERGDGRLSGIGICFYVEPCGQGWESARVEIHDDGTVTAATGSSTQGQGRETAYAGLVAAELGIPAGDVTVLSGDTGTCPEGIGALASRSTAIGGSALIQAVREARANAQRGEAGRAEVRYEAEGEAWGHGACLAVVSVDRDTGTVRVAALHCADDAGTIVDPALLHDQVIGGLAQGLGEALLERLVYDADGQLLTGSFTDYAMPRADDMPAVSVSSRQTPSPFNLLGAKGIGEGGTIAAPAAIVNAVHDAVAPLGITQLDLPLTSETIWRAIRAAQ